MKDSPAIAQAQGTIDELWMTKANNPVKDPIQGIQGKGINSVT